MMKRSAQTFIAAMALTCQAHAGPQYIPVANGLFSTGQWYFNGTKSEIGGNVAMTFVPALRFSNNFSVIPTLQSNYHGTRTAEELAGGNTLFQDTWENGVGVKGVHGLGKTWVFKENIGYRFKWFRETTDESWNHGLYDYHIYNAGGEIEKRWDRKTSAALGYDFSYLRFPNYTSLESSQGGDNSREFSGDNVLDARIHLVSLRLKTPLFWKMDAALSSYYSPRDYTNQTIVELTGLMTPTSRQDLYTGNTFSLERVFGIRKSRLISSIFYGYTGMNSNQNHYDADQTVFVADFYDYDQNAVGTQLTFAFGSKMSNPMLIETGYSYSHRNYRSRVIQAEDGTYKGEKLYLIEQSVNLGFSYPLSKNFRVRTTSTFGQSKSNNDYEANYSYNYHNAEYQFGFTYDY